MNKNKLNILFPEHYSEKEINSKTIMPTHSQELYKNPIIPTQTNWIVYDDKTLLVPIPVEITNNKKNGIDYKTMQAFCYKQSNKTGNMEIEYINPPFLKGALISGLISELSCFNNKYLIDIQITFDCCYYWVLRFATEKSKRFNFCI